MYLSSVASHFGIVSTRRLRRPPHQARQHTPLLSLSPPPPPHQQRPPPVQYPLRQRSARPRRPLTPPRLPPHCRRLPPLTSRPTPLLTTPTHHSRACPLTLPSSPPVVRAPRASRCLPTPSLCPPRCRCLSTRRRHTLRRTPSCATLRTSSTMYATPSSIPYLPLRFGANGRLPQAEY